MIKRAPRLLFLIGALASAGLTPVAPSSPAPTPSPSLEESTAVPALEPKGALPPSIQVGDALKFEVPGIEKLGPAPLKLEAIPGDPSRKTIYDQGWLATLDAKKGQALALTLTPTRPSTSGTPEIAVRAADGKWVARIVSLPVRVESAIAKDDPKPEEPDPAYPPLSAPVPWLWVGILGALLLALLSGLGYAVARALKRRNPAAARPMPAAPPLPEDARALEALTKLEAQGLPGRGEFKRHYFAASEILKGYLGDRYRFDALESTSGELLAFLRGIPEFPRARLPALETLLERMDLVKFTDEKPTPSAAALIVPEIRDLVTATRRVPPPATEGKPR